MVCVSFLAAVYFCAACGSSSSSSSTESTEGSALNSEWDTTAITCEGTITGGTFSDAAGSGAQVVVADGAITPCVNATATPTMAAATSLPDGFDLRATEGNVNVTQGGTAYTFTLNGDRGTGSTTEGAITLTLPFDPTLITTAADRTDTTKVFVRIINLDDESVLNVTGTISGGTITIDLRELPTQFTAAVIYNPNMAAAESVAAANAMIVGGITKATATTWPAQKWCVVYNTQSVALQTALASAIAATMQTLIKTAVSNMAANVQATYQNAGFAAPSLYIASTATDPCGGALGTDKRYLVHIDEIGTHYNYSEDPTQSANEIYYGLINIQPKHLPSAASKALGETGSVKAAFAHELLHAIQRSYGLVKPGNRTMKGYIEGTATTYGVTIDQGGTLSVRTADAQEIWLLSDFLMTNLRASGAVPAWAAYANQDFFAYVGLEYNSSSLDYLVGLFQQFNDDIEAEATAAADSATADNARYQPLRSSLLGSMDSFFQSEFGSSLEDIYLDFLKQRVFAHNASSQFGRTGETTSGFAQDLFAADTTDATKNAILSVTVEPDDCAVTNATGGFGSVGPFATRAVMITATKAATTTTYPTVSITLTPASGSIGDTWDGFSYRSGTTQAVSAGANTFTSFGAAATDKIIVALANITQDTRSYFNYEVTCDGAGGGGGGGSGDLNTFTLTDFTLPGEGSMTPAWMYFAPDLGGIGVLDAMIASTTDLTATYKYKNLQVQMSTALITGPGTYTILGNDPFTGPAAILYSPGTDAAAAGAGKVFESTGGTITISAWGTATGDHITGSFAATMEDDTTTPVTTGTMGATFDFVVGAINDL